MLLPLFRQLGYYRVTAAGHRDEALEYGKDVWMRYTLPTQHVLYFGLQAKKGKLDASRVARAGNAKMAEILNQALMMLAHEIKIEINTHERSPALPLVRHPHRVESAWWSGTAEVLTFEPAELVATKIRALYQRSKGRDLFDLWLALDRLHLDPAEILAAFGPYRPDGLSARLARANLDRKITDPTFRHDLDPLVTAWPDGYTIEAAGEIIGRRLLDQLDG